MLSYDVVINKNNPLNDTERPSDLVEPVIAWSRGADGDRRLMRREAAYMLEKLFVAAHEQGLHLLGVSAYRSYDRQRQIYEECVKERGLGHAKRYIALPGTSEHQSGLAIDVSNEELDGELEEIFAQSPEGRWIERNASLYGFVIRYPRGKEGITGYAYEPWHIRYVTRPLAHYLTRFGLVLEEYHAMVTR